MGSGTLAEAVKEYTMLVVRKDQAASGVYHRWLELRDSLLAYIKQVEEERDYWHNEQQKTLAAWQPEFMRAEAAEQENERLRETLRGVPYAITMALQWTLVPSDVPKEMHEPLSRHREMLVNVHDVVRAALAARTEETPSDPEWPGLHEEC